MERQMAIKMHPVKQQLKPNLKLKIKFGISNKTTSSLEDLPYFVFQSIIKYGEGLYRNKSMSESIRSIMNIK